MEEEAQPVQFWGVEEVAAWLQSLELGEHAASFVRSAIDGEMLLELSAEDLKALGVANKFHCRKILQRRSRLVEAERGAKQWAGLGEAMVAASGTSSPTSPQLQALLLHGRPLASGPELSPRVTPPGSPPGVGRSAPAQRPPRAQHGQ